LILPGTVLPGSSSENLMSKIFELCYLFGVVSCTLHCVFFHYKERNILLWATSSLALFDYGSLAPTVQQLYARKKMAENQQKQALTWKEAAEDAQKRKRAAGSEVKASAKNGCIDCQLHWRWRGHATKKK
jgi:hypothetical protein